MEHPRPPVSGLLILSAAAPLRLHEVVADLLDAVGQLEVRTAGRVTSDVDKVFHRHGVALEAVRCHRIDVPGRPEHPSINAPLDPVLAVLSVLVVRMIDSWAPVLVEIDPVAGGSMTRFARNARNRYERGCFHRVVAPEAQGFLTLRRAKSHVFEDVLRELVPMQGVESVGVLGSEPHLVLGDVTLSAGYSRFLLVKDDFLGVKPEERRVLERQ